MSLRSFAAAACAASLFAIPVRAARADDDDVRRQVEDLNRRMQEMEARHAREIAEMQRRLDAKGAGSTPDGGRASALQEQIDRLVDEMDRVRARTPAAPTSRASLRLVDVSLNVLATGGTSTGTERQIRRLQEGGHDPKKRGFTLQNTELILSGAVDPYFNATANLVQLLSPEGETEVELEEAFAQTTSLPAGLQVKAGQFYTAFGRHNSQHPHQWEFVDVPVANGRILGGDGMRGPGVQASWLGPVEVPVELTAAVQNANGEQMRNYLSGEPPVGAPVTRHVRTFQDTARSVRAAWSFDATDEIPILLGASGTWGPSGASDTGDARVVGLDLTAKWKPLTAEAGFPFLDVRAEWLARRMEYDVPGGTGRLADSGWYAQSTWGFARDWTLGLRHDRFNGSDDSVSGLDDRSRWSAALTFYTSEFAKVRLQVNRDHARALRDDVTSVWLQFEFNLGQHAAHKF